MSVCKQSRPLHGQSVPAHFFLREDLYIYNRGNVANELFNIFLKRMIYLLCCLKDFKRLYIKNLLCIQRCIEKQRKIPLLISTMILEKHPIVTLMCVTNFHFSILLMPVFILCITACLARINTNWRLLNCIINLCKQSKTMLSDPMKTIKL